MDDKLYEDYGIRRETRDEYRDRIDKQKQKKLEPVAETSEDEESVPTVETITVMGLEVTTFVSRVNEYSQTLTELISADTIESVIEASKIYRAAKSVLSADNIVLAQQTRDILTKMVEDYEANRAKKAAESAKRQADRDKRAFPPKY